MSLMVWIMKLILKILIWGVFIAFAGFVVYILFKILQPFLDGIGKALDKVRARKREIKSQNLKKLAEEKESIDTEAKGIEEK